MTKSNYNPNGRNYKGRERNYLPSHLIVRKAQTSQRMREAKEGRGGLETNLDNSGKK